MMNMRDLIPWGRGGSTAPSVYRDVEQDPFLTLHREVNRLFDDVFRGFDLLPFGQRFAGHSLTDIGFGGPNVEVSQTANEVIVSAELPGLAEQDVDVQLADGVLVIAGG